MSRVDDAASGSAAATASPELLRARGLLRDGRPGEAEAAYRQVLDRNPTHCEALNVLGLAALRAGDTARALDLLESATRAHPTDARSRFHLGRALDHAGEPRRAAAAYDTAATLEPGFAPASLHLGDVLQRTGEHARAIVAWVRAIDRAQRDGLWVDAATTPPNLRPLVERAVRALREEKRAVAERVLASVVARYGDEGLGRIRHAVRILVREELPVYPDPRQQPTFFHVPGLPPSAFLPRELFPWIPVLEARTEAIREELAALVASQRPPERVFDRTETERANLRGLDQPPSWTGYYFYRHGERRDDHCAACPATAAAIDALPLARIPERGPEVMFSVFTPGTQLLAHRGVTNARCVLHLPLQVPRDCALRVGGELHAWREGQAVVFDDTYEHEAWNRSDATRIVLIIDLWNPFLTAREREVIAELLPQLDVGRAVGSGH